MEQQLPEERRKAVRIKKQLSVQYQDLDDPRIWDRADIKDFSETGLVMVVERSFDPDTCLHFRIKIPLDPFRWHEFRGKVVASEHRKVRIRITEIGDEALGMVRQYIAWHLSQKKPRA